MTVTRNPNALCWDETLPDGEKRTYKMRFFTVPDEYVGIWWEGCDAVVVVPREILVIADQQGWEND